MDIELENFDKQRIERIKKLVALLYGEEEPTESDWVVVSAALRVYENNLKHELKEKRGE